MTNSRDGLSLRSGAGFQFAVFQVEPSAFYVPGLDYVLGFSGDPGAHQLHVRSLFADFVASRIP